LHVGGTLHNPYMIRRIVDADAYICAGSNAQWDRRWGLRPGIGNPNATGKHYKHRISQGSDRMRSFHDPSLLGSTLS